MVVTSASGPLGSGVTEGDPCPGNLRLDKARLWRRAGLWLEQAWGPVKSCPRDFIVGALYHFLRLQ